MNRARLLFLLIALVATGCGSRSSPVTESPTGDLEITFDGDGVVVVSFSTGQPAFARVAYGTRSNTYTHFAYSGDAASSDHSIRLIGASSPDTYYIRGEAQSADGTDTFISDEQSVIVEAATNVTLMLVTAIDVGWGDAIFVMTPNGTTILCDTGKRAYTVSSVIPYVQDEVGVYDIDYLTVSHCHSDHMEGIPDVLDNFSVGLFLDVPSVSADAQYNYTTVIDAVTGAGVPVDTIYAGETDASNPDALAWDPGVRVAVFNSGNDGVSTDPNNDSIVLKLTYGTVDVLLTGDARAYVESQILDAFGAGAVDVEVEKVPHHAVNASLDNSQAFIDAASPRVALVSANLGENSGSENTTILSRFRSVGADYYLTDNALPNSTPSASDVYRSHLRLITDGTAFEVVIDEPDTPALAR
jgi:beta-lactamase superfamily II metal-dependent hydrolase